MAQAKVQRRLEFAVRKNVVLRSRKEVIKVCDKKNKPIKSGKLSCALLHKYFFVE